MKILPKISSEKIITIPELKKLLEKIQAKRELSLVERVTFEYAIKFSKVDPEKVDSLKKELLDFGLPEEITAQLINIMPSTIEEIRSILSSLPKVFTTEEIKKIKDIIDKHR